MSPSHSRIALAMLFAFSGTMHFVAFRQYLAIMPEYVPFGREAVYLSGVLEILGGLALLVPSLRTAAGIGLILLLIAVFPANVQMLLNARAREAAPIEEALLWLRLPLQLLLMLWVWNSTRPRERVSRAKSWR